MGGTLKKLTDQHHNVFVAYMTSGSNGVRSNEAEKYIFFMKDFLKKHYFAMSKEENSPNIKYVEQLLNEAENSIEKG